MIPYALLRDIEPAVTGLFERIKAGELHAYTSVLTFDELAYRLLLALIRDQYSGSPMERLRDQKVQVNYHRLKAGGLESDWKSPKAHQC
jgi:hypothetical protein